MLSAMNGYAATPPEEPKINTLGPPGPVEPFGGPIDDNLILLGFIAISFGLYTIYKPIKKSV